MSGKPARGLGIPWAGLKPFMKGIGTRIRLFSLGNSLLIAGLVLLKASLWLFFRFSDIECVAELPLYFVWFAITIVWESRNYFVDSVLLKPERPLITQVGQSVSPKWVSPKEFLLRPSQVPPSHQQAELLRAAVYGKETPMEELLRATQRDRKKRRQVIGKETKSENIP